MQKVLSACLKSVCDGDADDAGRNAGRLGADGQPGGREHNETADHVHVELNPAVARHARERVHVVLVRPRGRLRHELRLCAERHDRRAAYANSKSNDSH